MLIERLNDAFGMQWEDADRIIKTCTDKICEGEDFVAKVHTNTMGNLRAIFDGVAMDALAAIYSDSADMLEKFSENPDVFISVMDDELLPIVYRRCNADVSAQALGRMGDEEKIVAHLFKLYAEKTAGEQRARY